MQVTIDSEEVERVFAAYPVEGVRVLLQSIEGSAVDVQREMRLNSPVHDGQYRRSVNYKVNRPRLTATIGPNVDYAGAVEKGSKPHWTSVKEGTPLRKWADDKGINPWAVQASIAKKGTKGQYVVEYTYDSMKFKVRKDIIRRFEKFVKKVNEGNI